MSIFTISPRLGVEDRFTAHWQYLLENKPNLGQRVVNFICDSSGIPKATYQKAIDHPEFTKTERPDFLLQCNDFDIVCEHKLDSNLGKAQLERYCKITKKRENAYLVLIANQAHIKVSDAVRSDALYRYPMGADCPYFFWESFYELVKETEGRLATEFLEYMESLGMAPWKYGEWGDPFMSDMAAEQFRQLWRPVKKLFSGLGVVRKVDRVSLGMQVQKPIEHIPLIYFAVKKGPSELHHEFTGPGIYLRVFAFAGSKSASRMGNFNDIIDGDIVKIDVRSPLTIEPINNFDKVLIRQYGVALSDILDSNVDSSKGRLVDFVQTSVDHLKLDIGSSE